MTSAPTYSGLHTPERWVLPAVLAEQAAQQADAPWFIGIGGETLSFGQAHADVQRAAGHFAQLGVQRGDAVVLMAGNHADFIRAWLGLLSLGAVAVLLNTELRGAFLRHQLHNSGAAWAVVDADLLTAVDAVAAEVPSLTRVLVLGDAAAAATPAPASPARLPWQDWQRASRYTGPLPQAQDTACIMYTSGTSGPSKGVLMPHAHCTLFGIGSVESVQARADDRWYIALPLFHANGLLIQLAATLLAGIPAIVRPRFSASQWLADIRQHRATVTNCLGALAAFIGATPATDQDRDHALRVISNGPNLPALEAMFRQRFGVRDVVSGYGMTEVNMPIWGHIGHSTPGAAGWVHTDHFELIIANPETDAELPRGAMGEILIRPRVPFGFMTGYHQAPERTVEAWRNLWFHSGDAGVMDASGLVTFVDRIKDCIRRRGENIAANEVENLLSHLPGVAEIAAYAVPSSIAGGEDELMLAIVPNPGVELTASALLALAESADALLPRFARPRYLQALAELPKTATGKVQRAVLRKAGSAGAVDRGEEQRRPKAEASGSAIGRR